MPHPSRDLQLRPAILLPQCIGCPPPEINPEAVLGCVEGHASGAQSLRQFLQVGGSSDGFQSLKPADERVGYACSVSQFHLTPPEQGSGSPNH